MYRLYNNIFIGITVSILIGLGMLFTYFKYDSNSLTSNIEYNNFNEAKEIFIKELTTINNENDLLNKIQIYYSYMPYEFDIYTVRGSGKARVYYLITESRNIESPEYLLQRNYYVHENTDLLNYLTSYIYLLQGNYDKADMFLDEIKDIRRYNIEFLKHWEEGFSNIRNTRLSSAIYLKQNIKNQYYSQIITHQLYEIYYETKSWEKLEELCSSEEGKYLSIQQLKWAYSASGNLIRFEFWNVISLIYTHNIINYIIVFLCFYFGFYYYFSFDTFNPNTFNFYLSLITYSIIIYLVFYIISERVYNYFDLSELSYYIFIRSGYVVLSLLIIYLLNKKYHGKIESYDYYIIGGVSTLIFSSFYMLQALEQSGIRYIGYLFILENFSNVSFTGIASYQIIYSLHQKKDKIWEGILLGLLLSMAAISVFAIVRFSLPEEFGNFYFNITFVILAFIFHYYLLNSINLSKSFTLKNTPNFINFFNGLLILFIAILVMTIFYCIHIYGETVSTGIILSLFSKEKAILAAAVIILIYKITPMKGYIFPFGLYLTTIHPFTFIERCLYEKGIYKIRKHPSTKDFAKHLLPNTISHIKEYPIKNENCYHLAKLNHKIETSPYDEHVIIKILYDTNLSSEYVQLYLIPKDIWSENKKITRADLTNAGMVRLDLA